VSHPGNLKFWFARRRKATRPNSDRSDLSPGRFIQLLEHIGPKRTTMIAGGRPCCPAEDARA